MAAAPEASWSQSHATAGAGKMGCLLATKKLLYNLYIHNKDLETCKCCRNLFSTFLGTACVIWKDLSIKFIYIRWKEYMANTVGKKQSQ